MSGSEEDKGVPTEKTGEGPRVSIFGIIVLGLFGGLIVGLIVGPSLTLDGFFLGFAGGALIAAGLYWYVTGKGPTK